MEVVEMGLQREDSVGEGPESRGKEAFKERPTTHASSLQSEPLDTSVEDCYRLREPMADSNTAVNDERYLFEESPMTAFQGVGTYIQRRHGENASAEKHGYYKTRHWRAKRQYARGKAMDRQLLDEFRFPSTILLSLRVSPGDKSRLALLERMKDAIDAAIDQLGYRLQHAPDAPFNADEWQYFAVVAGTDGRATPHLHIVVYCDGAVQQSWFEPVVEKFVEKCPDAPDSMRGNNPDEGAVRIRGLGHGDISRMDDAPSESAVATYVLGQLPHLQSVDDMALDQLLHSSTVDAWKGQAFRRSNYEVWDDEELPAQDEISEVDPTLSPPDGLAAFV
jgi:hypothetical protein